VRTSIHGTINDVGRQVRRGSGLDAEVGEPGTDLARSAHRLQAERNPVLVVVKSVGPDEGEDAFAAVRGVLEAQPTQTLVVVVEGCDAPPRVGDIIDRGAGSGVVEVDRSDPRTRVPVLREQPARPDCACQDHARRQALVARRAPREMGMWTTDPAHLTPIRKCRATRPGMRPYTLRLPRDAVAEESGSGRLSSRSTASWW
jgi:hypothetical protein